MNTPETTLEPQLPPQPPPGPTAEQIAIEMQLYHLRGVAQFLDGFMISTLKLEFSPDARKALADMFLDAAARFID